MAVLVCNIWCSSWRSTMERARLITMTAANPRAAPSLNGRIRRWEWPARTLSKFIPGRRIIRLHYLDIVTASHLHASTGQRVRQIRQRCRTNPSFLRLQTCIAARHVWRNAGWKSVSWDKCLMNQSVCSNEAGDLKSYYQTSNVRPGDVRSSKRSYQGT